MAVPTAMPLPGLLADEEVVDLTAPEFFAMIEAGVFPPERRVFLWGGRLCGKMARTAAHALTAYAIGEALRPHLGPGWIIWPENPVQLDPQHAPLPDVTVVRGPADRYRVNDRARHPNAGDVGLIVEVAVTSLAKDLGERAEKYARAMVPNYWVADVLGRLLITHAGPNVTGGAGAYDRVEALPLGGIVILMLDGRDIARLAVADLLSGVLGP